MSKSREIANVEDDYQKLSKKSSTNSEPMLKNEKEKSLGRNISALIRDWGMTTSLHGVKNGFMSRNIFIRIVWYLLTLICFAYCVYSSYLQVKTYSQHNVVTSIEEIYEAPTRFPVVAICNLNAFDSFETLEIMNYEQFENISNSKNLQYNNTLSDVLNLRTSIKSYMEAIYDTKDLYNFTFKIEDVLIFCKFGGIYLF
jgi:hypothetical protein